MNERCDYCGRERDDCAHGNQHECKAMWLSRSRDDLRARLADVEKELAASQEECTEALRMVLAENDRANEAYAAGHTAGLREAAEVCLELSTGASTARERTAYLDARYMLLGLVDRRAACVSGVTRGER